MRIKDLNNNEMSQVSGGVIGCVAAGAGVCLAAGAAVYFEEKIYWQACGRVQRQEQRW